MGYLLWGILNFLIFVSFIAICFSATKLVRERFGLLASIIFVFGLLSFATHPQQANSDSKSNQLKTWQFISEDSLHSKSLFNLNVILEKTLISENQLNIVYALDSISQTYVPVSASSMTSGVICGTEWKPSVVSINRNNDNSKLEYVVLGTVNWNLLGTPLFAQAKVYRGVVKIP